MFDRSLQRVVGIGAAVGALAIAAPLAAADPTPHVMPDAHQSSLRPGEGLTGADRTWLSLQQTTPRLGEGLNGADRSWLPRRTSDPPVASTPNRFHWGDAGIGAGTAVAFVLVVSGGALLIRRRLSPAH